VESCINRDSLLCFAKGAVYKANKALFVVYNWFNWAGHNKGENISRTFVERAALLG